MVDRDGTLSRCVPPLLEKEGLLEKEEQGGRKVNDLGSLTKCPGKARPYWGERVVRDLSPETCKGVLGSMATAKAWKELWAGTPHNWPESAEQPFSPKTFGASFERHNL